MSVQDVNGRAVRFTLASAVASLPQPVWLILFALAIGLAGGLNYTDLVRAFGAGYGRALGDFTLILLPSFVLAACISRQRLDGASGLAAAVAPLTAAGMVCPDTGYATLSSIAGRRKLSVAFGSFAGFRLLFPAGPLIIATGLGVDDHANFVIGLLLLVPIWIAGELWVRYRLNRGVVRKNEEDSFSGGGTLSWRDVQILTPLIVLGILLLAGAVGSFKAYPFLDFVCHPKGALFVAAAWALISTPQESRRECVDSAMRRTGWLLIVIGAASAFGGMIVRFVPLESILPAASSATGVLLTLFAMTMIIKILYGSAMATFATAAALLAPIVTATGTPGVPAVFAICLGSFAILPTDSFYWLVRSDALAGWNERDSIITLAGGAALQAAIGLLALLGMHVVGLI
jgi:GntP family gluconate:H+ symporter